MKFSEELALRLKGTSTEEIEKMKKAEEEETKKKNLEKSNLEIASGMIQELEKQLEESNAKLNETNGKLEEALKQIELNNNQSTQGASGAAGENDYNAASVLKELFNKEGEQ